MRAVYISQYCPDFWVTKRTWKQRLFTLPWKPFVSETREIAVYILQGTVVVSHRTANLVNENDQLSDKLEDLIMRVPSAHYFKGRL